MQPGYIPQLDGIRAIAVSFVLIQHYSSLLGVPQVAPMPIGNTAVRCFFVLSGFLITRILLAERLRVETGETTKGQVARRFYARRALRILPLYYVALAACVIFNVPNARQEFGWHALYVSNIYLSLEQAWAGTALGHFWTLAVEEQFYLVWPALVLLLPRRWIPGSMVALIVAAPLFRAAVFLAGYGEFAAARLTPSCFDSLALGALLAWCRTPAREHGTEHQRLIRLCVWLGLPLFVCFQFQALPSSWALVTVASKETSYSMASVWLINGAADGFSGGFGRLLAWEPVRYIGKISYGLYVIHMPMVHGFVPMLNARFGLGLDDDLRIRVVVAFLATLALAAASWRFFESPILRLKRRFQH